MIKNSRHEILISIVTPCYNEGENIEELYKRVAEVMSGSPYLYEHIFIDNASTDETIEKLKEIAARDSRVKLIINTRNFGHIRSPYYGVLQSKGDVCILIASDLQDPPELIPEFIKKWELGFRIVLAVKLESEENQFVFGIRNWYYKFISRISEVPLINGATGAGLFDGSVVEILRKIQDPNPYFRGLLCEIGFPIAVVPFKQPERKKGKTKNNFYTLFDLAMLGITNHSKVPLRLMTIGGFLLALLSMMIALVFFMAKVFYWDSFQLGIAPIIIGIFFFGAIQAFFIGMLGEYIGSIHTLIRNMPLVIEAERVNFDKDTSDGNDKFSHNLN